MKGVFGESCNDLRVLEIAFLGHLEDDVPEVEAVDLPEASEHKRSLKSACQLNANALLRDLRSQGFVHALVLQ